MSDIDKQIREILRDFDNAASIYAIEVKARYETANSQIQELISTAVREAEEMARLDGQLMALNSFYNSGEIGSDSYKISVKQIADRFAQLKEEE